MSTRFDSVNDLSRPAYFLALLIILAWAGLLCERAHADAPLEGTKPAQWRLVWKQDPTSQATLCWSTATIGDRHEVRMRRKGDTKFDTHENVKSGNYGSDPLSWHCAELTGLSPATEYEVQMVSDGEASPILYFATAPEQDRSFTLLFGGDSRSSSTDRRAMNELIAKLTAKSYEDDEPANDVLALVHGGDYIVSGTSLSQWSQWMSDHELTVSEDGRLLPIVPARGNHDRGPLFNQVFGFPPEDENQYTISIADELTLITLNTNESTAGDQALWLESQLKEARPDSRWLLAQYHRPAYPAVKSPGSALRDWTPLFDRYDVDLVCEADGHCIKRTVAIRDGKQDPTGVVYIGEGGLGVGQRTPKSDRWFLQPPGMTGKGHHVQRLTFTSDALVYECILMNGDVIDTYRRSPRR